MPVTLLTVPQAHIVRYFQLAPVQYAVNVFRILGNVDALNEQMGLRLTHHDVLVLQFLVPQG